LHSLCIWFTLCIVAFRNAVPASQVAVLQWLQQQRPPCTYDESAVAAAVAGGHVSVLQWLWEVEGPNSLLLLRQSSADCTAAAAGGHLQVRGFDD
jgi:hypothetical protein